MSAVCYCGRPACPVTTWDEEACNGELRALRVQRDALAEALRWCEANWTKPAVDRGAGLPMIRAALARLKEET